MKTIVLVMKRTSLAQGLMKKLAPNNDIRLCYESDYASAEKTVTESGADGILLEITEDRKYDADYCLGLCRLVRNSAPGCRQVLMCPENDSDAVKKAIEAKQSGIIEDFVFYDVSLDYLETTLRAL